MAGNSTSTMRAASKAPTAAPHNLAQAITNYQLALAVAEAVDDPNGDAPEFKAAWNQEMSEAKVLLSYQCATPDDVQRKISAIFAYVPLRDLTMAEPHLVASLLQSFVPPIDKAIRAYSEAVAFASTVSDEDEDAWNAAQNKVWDAAGQIIDTPCHTFDQVQRKFQFIRDNRAVSDCLTMGHGAVMDLVFSIAGRA